MEALRANRKVPSASSLSDRQTSTTKSAPSTDGGSRSLLEKPSGDFQKAPFEPMNEKMSRATDDASTARSEETGFMAVITADRSNKHLYITGVRGILVVEAFIWTYFQTFIPVLVSDQTDGPEYQDLLREIFSVPFWNTTLIQNFFIILSMRTICVSFLQSPTSRAAAGTVIRRIVRFAIALSVAAGLAQLIFSQIDTQYIDDFMSQLPNDSIRPPGIPHDGLAAVNSLFLLFWVTKDFYTQAANNFWPTQTIWVPSLMYFQSFTVYFLMIILPFTRPKWHLPGMAVFALGSFWYGSWGWYSATGLIFADMAINKTIKSELNRGLKIKDDHRLPYWVPAIVFGFIGFAMKYAFTVRSKYANNLAILHPFVDLSESTSFSEYTSQPYARLDDWFMIVGILIAVEMFEPVQHILSFKPLVWLGERSLSIYVMQTITFWSAGIKLWLLLHVEKHMSVGGANAVVFIVCLLAIALFSELFYRLVDLPSQWAARHAWIFLIT